MVTIEDIYAAAERIKGRVLRTPTIYCQALSKRLDTDITLKLENLQAVGSFKERGAANRLALLSEEEKKRGLGDVYKRQSYWQVKILQKL